MHGMMGGRGKPPRANPTRSSAHLRAWCGLQMFQDLAILVDTQGQLLDRIEYNVAESKTFVGKGVDELRRVRSSRVSE